MGIIIVLLLRNISMFISKRIKCFLIPVITKEGGWMTPPKFNISSLIFVQKLALSLHSARLEQEVQNTSLSIHSLHSSLPKWSIKSFVKSNLSQAIIVMCLLCIKEINIMERMEDVEVIIRVIIFLLKLWTASGFMAAFIQSVISRILLKINAMQSLN